MNTESRCELLSLMASQGESCWVWMLLVLRAWRRTLWHRGMGVEDYREHAEE